MEMEMDAPRLVGRGVELEVVRRFLSRSARDGGGLVLSGRTGVGKSAVVDWAVSTARAAGSAVLSAGAVGLETDVPFAVLNQLLLPARSSFDGLDPALREALIVALGFREGPEPDVPVVADAAERVLRTMSMRAPVLLTVDDWHLVDERSVEVLVLLARRLSGVRVGVLVTLTTDDDDAPPLRGLPRLELAPLDPVATAELLRGRFPSLTADVAARVATEVGGYPLVLVESSTALSEQERTGRSALPDPLPLTRRLLAAFGPRIGALSPATRRSLLVVALADPDDRPSMDGPAGIALGRAQRERLVRVDPRTGRVGFPHPLIGSTVVALSTSAERRIAHRELARLAGTPERRAGHLAAAVVEPDEAVARLLERGARQALRRGERAAGVAALVRGSELSPRRSDRSRRMVLAAYAEARLGGRLRAAADLLAQADRIDPGSRGTLGAAVATAYVVLHGDGDLAGAHHAVTEAVLRHAAGAAGLDEWLVEARQTLSDLRTLGGGMAPSTPGLDEVLSVGQVGAGALVCDRSGDRGAEVARPVRGAGGAPTRGAPVEEMVLLASDHLAAGRWREAERWSQAGLTACRESGHELIAQQLRLCQAQVAAATGEFALARSLAVEIEAWAAPRRLGALTSDCAHVRTLAASGECDFELAYRQASAISPAGMLGPDRPRALSVALDLVESAVRTHRHDQAAAHAEALRASGVAGLSPRLAMVVAASSGMTAPSDRARTLFEKALSSPDVERWPFELARVRLIYGERLRRMRAPGEARSQLEAALDTFARLGATPWWTRTRKELNATGLVAIGADGSRLDPLTPQEREVALLAATGLSNRRIAERLLVSHRTVGAHLRQVFPKLGIASRASLRDALGCDPLGA